MDSTQQLIKRDFQNGGYRDIFPKNYTENIRDKETGEFLDVLLAKVNFWFLPYHISPEHTRLQVPESRRRLGLWISYIIPNEHRLVIEYYLSDNIEDSYWSNDAYWFGTNGNTTARIKGTTVMRPELNADDMGYLYFDTTLNKPIWWTGTDWVDATGVAV